MKKILSAVFLACVCLSAQAQLTEFEKSNGNKTATYFEAIDWYNQLAKNSDQLIVKEMGPTDAGYPLHLVLISSDKTFDPAVCHKQQKIIILVNNGIHPGEPDGIDASMMLARDIIQKKKTLPANIVLAIIPVYNIGGCLNRNAYSRANQNGPEEYGFRGNSQNLDLNRDFTKSDSKEAKSFAAIFHYLEPDILIDNHVSDGADFQHTMTLISTQYDKLGPVLGKWLKEVFEPTLYQGMKTKGWDLIPYVDFENEDISKGIKMFMETPRYSSGYASLFSCLSFIPETHMLKAYADRVRSTYDLMQTFIEQASLAATSIIDTRKKAMDSMYTQHSFPLAWRIDTTRFSTINFKGYDIGYTRSEATGLTKMYFDRSKPYTKQVKFFDTYQPARQVESPMAYIIPQGWYSVVALLKINNVAISQVQQDSLLTVTVYHINDYKSYPSPYEKHHKNYAIVVSSSRQQVKILKGDYLVKVQQPAKRYIIEMLEPIGDDSFFAWNFFDAILQQKEGYSDYRWEDLAAAELQKDTVLQQKLQARKASDSTFATNSGAILEFIYRRSKYFEKAFLRYPVYRIEN